MPYLSGPHSPLRPPTKLAIWPDLLREVLRGLGRWLEGRGGYLGGGGKPVSEEHFEISSRDFFTKWSALGGGLEKG